VLVYLSIFLRLTKKRVLFHATFFHSIPVRPLFEVGLSVINLVFSVRFVGADFSGNGCTAEGAGLLDCLYCFKNKEKVKLSLCLTKCHVLTD
jgi:hypothetical protein